MHDDQVERDAPDPKSAKSARPDERRADLAGKPSSEIHPEARPAEERTFDATAGSAVGGPPPEEERPAPLFAPDEAEQLRGRWDSVQAGFVDEPRAAVEKADSLVALTMKRLAEMFADERAKLEGQWDRGEEIDTEDLRLVLRRYRSFFGRLLSF